MIRDTLRLIFFNICSAEICKLSENCAATVYCIIAISISRRIQGQFVAFMYVSYSITRPIVNSHPSVDYVDKVPFTSEILLQLKRNENLKTEAKTVEAHSSENRLKRTQILLGFSHFVSFSVCFF